MNPIKPTLITTFISTQRLTPLTAHLARPKLEGGLGLEQEEDGVWQNAEDKSFIIPLEHPELRDVRLMQLVINPGGEAPEAWRKAAEQLERALRDLPNKSQEALLAMTLIYQAVVPPNTALDDSLASLLGQFQLLSSTNDLYLRPLASGEVRGGKLWLLQSAIQDKRNVYLALGTEAEEETLTVEVLFDKDAALLWADTIAHKAYAMLRNYRPQDERDIYRQANKALTERVQTILATNLLPEPATLNPQQAPTRPNTLPTLNDLSSKAAKFTNATVALQQLQSDLEVHRFNLKLASEHFATRMGQESNSITTYHQGQLERNIFRIQQDLTAASATQDAINTALNYLRAIEEHEQTELAKRQEESNKWIQLLLAVIGLIVGVGGLVVFDLELVLMRLAIMLMIGVPAGWLWYKRRQGS